MRLLPLTLFLIALSGCCHQRCRTTTVCEPMRAPFATRVWSAHGVAVEKARLAYSTPEPGESQRTQRYDVGDLHDSAAPLWAAMRRDICDSTAPTWFGVEDCTLARRDWRWILAIVLHIGPGLGWGNYTDHVALDGANAIRIRATTAVHEALGVYFETLRNEIARHAVGSAGRPRPAMARGT